MHFAVCDQKIKFISFKYLIMFLGLLLIGLNTNEISLSQLIPQESRAGPQRRI